MTRAEINDAMGEVGQLSQFTLLVGNETIGRRRARHQLVERIRKSHPNAVMHIFDTQQQSVDELVGQVLTPSMFGATRIFLMPHAELLCAEELATLEKLITAPLDDEYVIVEADVSDENERAFTAFLRSLKAREKERPCACKVLNFERPKPWDIPKWLVENVPRQWGRRISLPEASYLHERVGDDFDNLRSELEKIDLYLGKGEPITREAIDIIVEPTREVAAFELAQALGGKDLVKALGILEQLFSSTFYAPLCIGAIFRHFWVIQRLKAFEEKSPEVVREFVRAVHNGDRHRQTTLGLEIGKAAGLLSERQANRVFPVLVKSKVVEHARLFTTGHLRAVFRWLHDIDVGVKTGRIEPTKAFMQMLCLRIIRGPAGWEDEQAYSND